MEEYYYYCRDKDNIPLITVCLIRQDGIITKGVSICSPLDSPYKKQGRRIARNKALKALGKKKTGDKVNRTVAVNIIYRVGFHSYWKSVYQPELSLFEKKILSIELEKEKQNG